MQGHYDFGDGRKKEDPNYMIFSQRNCNYPQPKYAIWWLTQFRRWGMVTAAPDYKGVAKQVMRTDIYEEAMKEIGVKHGGLDNKPETLFDGVTFDPAKPEEYAQSFAVKNLQGVTLATSDRTTPTMTNAKRRFDVSAFLLPLVGALLLLGLWAVSSATLAEEPAVAGEDLGGERSRTSWSRSKSAASSTRASCASPGTRWCWWRRATRWRC